MDFTTEAQAREQRCVDAAIAVADHELLGTDYTGVVRAVVAADDGYARATADIVAWLREHTASNMARVFADAIERGDFRKGNA